MERDINMEVNDFFLKYKSKDIIYPNAVAIYLDIPLKEAYEICKNRQDLKPLYMILCPACNHILPIRYYSIVGVDTDMETECNHCGYEFLPDIDRDVYVYYEKI